MPTKIEWCRNPDFSPGESWNPYHGCWNGRCPLYDRGCYAQQMANRLRGRFGYPADDPFRPVFDEGRLKIPYKWKRPRRVFVGSMGELGYVRPSDFRRVLEVVRDNPRHTFIFLTKTPSILSEYNPWPKNAWAGASATTQAEADDAVRRLIHVNAWTRFLSLEPLLGPVTVNHSAELKIGGIWAQIIDWVIVGRCTGPKAEEHPTERAWVERLVAQLKKDHVPIFMKNNLRPMFTKLRQEWPK